MTSASSTTTGSPRPQFSVVIPTYQRPAVLAKTLDLLTPGRQGVPAQSFEIVVTDDSRNDATERLVRDRYPHVRYVRGARDGPAANRNSGAAAAIGEWVAFIDDDCQPQDGWLAALQRAASAAPVDVIEGAILAPDKVDSPFRHYGENVTGGVFWSGNLAIRRDVFYRLGRFDEDFKEAAGDDLELASRIRRSGLSTVFCKDAAVVHPSHVVSWRYIFWHAFTIRWHVLYGLKTGDAASLDTPMWRAVPALVQARIIFLLRVTWHSLRSPDPARRKTTLFNVALAWGMFPILLPYMLYWDRRYRRMLRQRRDRLSSVVTSS